MNGNSKEPISSLLARPHFQTSQSNVAPNDPVIPTRIVITLDQVIAYTDNPRQTQNPMYEEIKESIRNRGLDHAPNVTRKNPADPYMIKDGGNTRLQILRELWEETGDEKFNRLSVMFHPWTNDLDVLIGHMIENEMRGNMIFIERAIAAKKVKQQIEANIDKAISVNALAKHITDMGWSLNQSNLNQMLYAEENLLSIIPEAFWSGIGIDRVKKIRKLLDACRNYWETVSNSDEGLFDDIWRPVFTRLDGDGFDVAAAEYQLCGAMSQRMDGPVLSVTAQIQAILEGVKNIELSRPCRFEPVVQLSPPPNTKQPNIPKAKHFNESAGERNLQKNTLEAGASSKPQEPQYQQATSIDQHPHFNPVHGASKEQASDISPATLSDDPLAEEKYALSDLPGGTPVLYSGYATHPTYLLHDRAFSVAAAYAKCFGLHGNIVSAEGVLDAHVGFWVTSSGFESMTESQRIHWVMLSTLALTRHHDRAKILLENMAQALGGEIDIVSTVSLLMSVTHARTLLLGETARKNEALKHVWESLTELEAIASTLLTRTYEESQEIDETPDASFMGVERETGRA